jgi:hypothetical protein
MNFFLQTGRIYENFVKIHFFQFHILEEKKAEVSMQVMYLLNLAYIFRIISKSMDGRGGQGLRQRTQKMPVL